MSTHTLADGLYESLKRQIVENKIEPGTILTEHGIAALHSVSRAPAREALKRLVASGFASARRRVGYIVPHVSVADVDEVYALRLLLEPAATALAVPRLTEADVAVLDDLAAGILHVAAAPIEKHGALYSRLNAEFHREIARVSGNGRLERTITSLIDELERVMHMLAYSSTMASVLEEHTALMRVMRSRDAARAAALMRQQLEHDYGVMRALVTGRGQR
jgi:DNA-binding GntR family transcriptional regulator